jgi:hypothetical protein
VRQRHPGRRLEGEADEHHQRDLGQVSGPAEQPAEEEGHVLGTDASRDAHDELFAEVVGEVFEQDGILPVDVDE